MKFLALCALIFGTGLLYLPTVFADHSININTADTAALVTLTGIGEVKAQAIIDYRTQNGPFTTIEDIQNVSGIGPATYDGIKEHITLQGGTSSAPPPSPSPTPSATPASPSPSSASSPQAVSSAGGLSVDAGSDRVVVAGADVHFLARSYREKKIVEDVRFVWNFGDGSTAKGSSPLHRFKYPGRYAVVVTASLERDSSSDRFIVTAEEARLVLHVLPDGSVEIENLGLRDADLSYWSIKSGSSLLMLSEHFEVLAGQAVRIAPATLGFRAEASAELDYPDGSLAFRAGDTPASPSPPTPPASVSAASGAGEINSSTQASEREELASRDISDEEVIEADEPVSTSPQVAAAAQASEGSLFWWAAALAIALVGAGSIHFARRYAKGEWDIIEERES